jgi:glycosyltransferase involved in cell wall biosynthesis
MRNTPFFSVIIPSYNRGKVIKETIETVLSQTYPDFELIIVDDGSTDNTKDVIEEVCSSDNRVRYIYQENQERCVARNNGIKNAKGKWICFLDSDDFYKSNHLQTFKDLIDKHPGHNAFATCMDNANLKLLKGCMLLELKDFVSSNNINLAQICYNRTHLNSLYFPDNNKVIPAEDLYFIRTLTVNSRILQTNTITVYKKEQPERVDSRLNNPAAAANGFLNSSIEFVKKNKVDNTIQSGVLSFAYLVAANIMLGTRNKAEGFNYLLKAMHYKNTFIKIYFYNAVFKLLFYW